MSQQEFWNSKFSRDGFLYGIKPNTFIASKTKLFPKNAKILCIGEGEGRNAIFFAKKGFEVTAIDASDLGLKKLEERAKEENLNIFYNKNQKDVNKTHPFFMLLVFFLSYK